MKTELFKSLPMNVNSANAIFATSAMASIPAMDTQKKLKCACGATKKSGLNMKNQFTTKVTHSV